MCARSEFRSETAGVEDIIVDSDSLQPFYNLQGFKVDHPKIGDIYIHNGKKLVFK